MEVLKYLFLSLFFSLLISSCHGTDPLWQYCDKIDNRTWSQTSARIGYVLKTVATRASSTGFATTSSGRGDNNTVYGLAQCRGDVSSADCRACITDAAQQLPKLCPNQADTRIWFDYCFLRYDTGNFIGEPDDGIGLFYINVENATDPKRFNKELGALMDRVRSQAVVPSNKGLGRGESKFTPLITIYGLGQCTRNLSPLSCAQCLANAVASFATFCPYRKGCRALYSSCYVRYEIYPFFFPLDSTENIVTTSSVTKVIVYP